MKKFKIKAFYNNGGYQITEITGKNLGDAFYKFYKTESKRFQVVLGFELIQP